MNLLPELSEGASELWHGSFLREECDPLLSQPMIETSTGSRDKRWFSLEVVELQDGRRVWVERWLRRADRIIGRSYALVRDGGGWRIDKSDTRMFDSGELAKHWDEVIATDASFRQICK